MTDNTNGNPQGGDPAQPQGGTTGSAHGAGEADLLSKIAELERDNKKYRDERKAQDAATRKQQEEQLASQQQWETLAKGYKTDLDKLQPVAEQNEVITAAFNEILEGQLKDIPSNVRKSIVDPARENMSPVAFSKWIREFVKQFPAPQAPPLDGGAGGQRTDSNPVLKLTPEQIDMANAGGVPLDVYAKRLAEVAERKRNPRKE